MTCSVLPGRPTRRRRSAISDRGQVLHDIRRHLAALLVCAVAFHGAARRLAAQDSSVPTPDLPTWLLATTGIEADPSRGSVVVLPSPLCPLTSNQLNAVRAGV